MKVLFVEDHEGIHKGWTHDLRGEDVQILSAFDLEQARRLYSEHPDIDIIVVDGELDFVENGGDFIKEIRPVFTGKIIAASSSVSGCLDMVGLGADFSCEGQKSEVPQIIKQILAGN